MRPARALVAANPLRFGRGQAWLPGPVAKRSWRLPDDVKLFATTFAAGFVFVSILIS